MMHVDNLAVDNRLDPISFSLNQGEKLHIIGPNGSGKSTLLNGLAGMIPVTGSVELAGCQLLNQGVERQAYLRAFLAQNERPGFHIEAHQYLQLSRPGNNNNEEFERVVEYLCRRLSLLNKLGHSILHLSGGEWQRVRLAGICLQVWPTLNPESRLLLLDEPAAALDIGQERLLYELVDEVAGFGISVIMANHDLNRTLHYADKALLLDGGKLVAFDLVKKVVCEPLVREVFDTEVQMIHINGKSHLIFN